MLKSALNYFTSEVAEAATTSLGEHVSNDDIVGSTLDVGGTGVVVKKRIGEGGFAFVYSVVEQKALKPLALKRLLAVDPEKREQIVQEITFLKNLQACPNILQFIQAANMTKGLSATKCEEFLVLTELCVASLYDYLSVRTSPYPPVTVARILFQTLEAVGHMHRANPPISHRDLKIENLLISSDGKIKLCDFGSASTKTYNPDQTWNMQRRTAMEEEIAKFTTPMYRAPEMVDAWSNYPVGTSSDVWALGCLLYQLCFHRHPFEDGAKLAIINANFSIPETDTMYLMFHDLIRQILAVDPSWRPSCPQVQEHLGEIAILNGWDLEARIDFEQHEPVQQKPLVDLDNRQSSPVPSDKVGPGSTASYSVTATHLISSFRGGAGSMLGKIKESSKAVVSSLLAPKDLDFHLLSGRIAGMSFPSDGIDLTYKNQMEDIRQIMEARHADHYAVINLSERKYAHSRFSRGVVIDPNWTTMVTPPVFQLLDVTMKALEFLGQHKQNVIAIHCLDGRSNTAMLFASILVVCKIFSRSKDALSLFELKRCEPILTFGQRSVLKQMEKLVKLGPSINITLQSISIHSVVLEPIPLFTKANDGVRPFIEVYSNGQFIATSFTDYNALKLFTSYDGEVVLKFESIKVPYGDVTVMVYHGRQSLGSFFGNKVEKVKICQVYFNPAYVASQRSFVRFPTHELDCLGDVERIPGNFSITVNFNRKESRNQKFPYILPERRKLELVFQNKSEFEEAMEITNMDASTSPQSRNPQLQEDFECHPEPPPRTKKRESPLLDIGNEAHESESKVVKDTSNMPKPSSLVDIVGSQSDPLSNLIKEQKKPSSLLDFGNAEMENKRNEEIEKSKDDILLDFGKPQDDPLLDISTQQDANKGDLNDILGDFDQGTLGSDAPPARPRVPQPGSQTQSPMEDLLNVSGSLKEDLLAPLAPSQSSMKPSSSSQASVNDLLGDFGSSDMFSAKSTPMPTTSDQLVDDMLSKLDMNTASSTKSQPPKPNYSSAFFNPTASASSTKKQPPSKATFDDLLGGFAPASESSNKTIGEMKKEVDKQHMDPEEASIFEWTHGKSRNLRALLCSLDAIIWPNSRWTKCGMHQLVTHSDVKKMYRKACLAVHPDKQTGSENERLSKLIFTELNDGWSKFQEDEPI